MTTDLFPVTRAERFRPEVFDITLDAAARRAINEGRFGRVFEHENRNVILLVDRLRSEGFPKVTERMHPLALRAFGPAVKHLDGADPEALVAALFDVMPGELRITELRLLALMAPTAELRAEAFKHLLSRFELSEALACRLGLARYGGVFESMTDAAPEEFVTTLPSDLLVALGCALAAAESSVDADGARRMMEGFADGTAELLATLSDVPSSVVAMAGRGGHRLAGSSAVVAGVLRRVSGRLAALAHVVARTPSVGAVGAFEALGMLHGDAEALAPIREHAVQACVSALRAARKAEHDARKGLNREAWAAAIPEPWRVSP